MDDREGKAHKARHMAIDTSFLKSLDRLQLILKRKVHADLQGQHQASAFGQGLVFQDYKAYVPGDDFRHIDWNIFARTDKFFIRRFEEERNLVVHILVDSSGSMDYGKQTTKFEYAAMIGLGFSYMALRRNERFTFATFTDTVERLPPRKGAKQLINILEKTGATSFLISEVQGIENMGHGLVEEFLADGVIIFYNLQKRNVKQNALEILKMRSVNHEKKIVPFEFVKGQGIVVYPLERTFM